MIKELIQNPIFHKLKSKVAIKEDLQVVQDSLNILIAYKDGCIGIEVNIIVIC